MARSIEDIMNEIEDFLNSCKTTTLSSNKVVVPRDEFDELFGDLKVKIPAEIDRCKKIMRNKDAILMDARKTADQMIAQAGEQVNQMIAETEIMAQANQKAYETVEMARVQANDILAQAVAEANEIRLGSMQYTNDIMVGIRDYVQATMDAERANYENLIERLNNDYLVANANIDEIQNQIVEFTGDPSILAKSSQKKTSVSEKKDAHKQKQNMVQKVKQAVGRKEDKLTKEVEKENGKPAVDIPDFIASGEKTVPNVTSLESTESLKKDAKENKVVKNVVESTIEESTTNAAIDEIVATTGIGESAEGNPKKVVKKKIVKKRNPVIHTPQTAQETVAKTVEAAKKVDKTEYKAEIRDVPAMEGRVKRGPRVGRGLVEEYMQTEGDSGAKATGDNPTKTKSLGVVDDYTMEKKI